MPGQKIVLFILLIVSGALLLAFSNAKPAPKAVYDYVAIVQDDTFEILVSEQGKELRRVKFKYDKNAYDFRAIFEEVNKYEAEGWELYSNMPFNVTGPTNNYRQNYFLLRRRKP
jgi:hypothetical protein